MSGHRIAVPVALLCTLSCSFFPRGPVTVDPAKLDADGRDQGEYVGASPALGIQVVALGDGRFEAALYPGGLPGAGFTESPVLRATGTRDGAGVHLQGDFAARLQDQRLEILAPKDRAQRLERVDRASPSFDRPPEPGAVVLFGRDGANAMEGAVDERGFLSVPAQSRDTFRDFFLHVEFRTPFMPRSREQGRGNSGVYLQDRYEVQILDSFGRSPASNQCGALYEVAAPRVAAAFPPLAWQTYDIEFRAARFDAEGNKVENARVSVDHNGIRVHAALELPGPTGFGARDSGAPGPIVLQDHGSPVAYRNLWILPRP